MGKGMIFKNDNGRNYAIVAGDNGKALLRELRAGGYVIARDLDWTYMCWSRSGAYYAADEFEKAVEAFLGRDSDAGKTV